MVFHADRTLLLLVFFFILLVSYLKVYQLWYMFVDNEVVNLFFYSGVRYLFIIYEYPQTACNAYIQCLKTNMNCTCLNIISFLSFLMTV